MEGEAGMVGVRVAAADLVAVGRVEGAAQSPLASPRADRLVGRGARPARVQRPAQEGKVRACLLLHVEASGVRKVRKLWRQAMTSTA